MSSSANNLQGPVGDVGHHWALLDTNLSKRNERKVMDAWEESVYHSNCNQRERENKRREQSTPDVEMLFGGRQVGCVLITHHSGIEGSLP